MSNTTTTRTTYNVNFSVVFDHPELRGASFSSVKPGTTVTKRIQGLTLAQANALVADLESGGDDFSSECVFLISVWRHGKFTKQIREISRNTERWDACCTAVRAADWAA